MENLIDIAALAALLIFIILAVFAIFGLVKMSRFLDSSENHLDAFRQDLSEIKERSIRTMDEVTEMKNQVNSAINDLNDIREQAVVTLQGVDEMRDELNEKSLNILSKVDNFVDSVTPYKELLQDAYQKIAPPVTKTANTFSAITKGIAAFRKRLAENSNKKHQN